MSAGELDAVEVRPIRPDERGGFDAALEEHHWLGSGVVGETMRYVALGPDDEWLAVLGFGAAALSCGPRDRFIGWSEEQHFRRLRFVTNNQRFCVLPAGRRANVASHVLAKTLKRLSGDFEARWGHPVLLVETFVDPARHRGTCYSAAGFALLGETLGYGRSSGRYHYHGRSKLSFGRLLRRDARAILTGGFDHPALLRGSRVVIDLERLDFDSDAGGLLAALQRIADHRKRRGVRHSLASLLAIATAATLAGARSVAAIGEYAADCPQSVLARLGAKYHPVRRCYVAPHADTIRRALAAVDTEALDEVVGAWLLAQVRAGHLDSDQLVLALDGKSMRGALGDDGRAVHLFAAMVHGAGIVVGQQRVEDKSNEITAFGPLLDSLDLAGAVVTADALHAQREHARWLVADKHADYLFQVKGNQPGLLAACQRLDDAVTSRAEDTCRGHGRIERRDIAVAPAPEGLDFPHAAQVIVVYRERADLDGVLVSSETSYYLTSVAADRADAQQLGQHVRGHWGIENKVHYVRDVDFDEDRHQLRAALSGARALATLRNLTVGLLRLAGVTNIAQALRWVARDPHRAAALLGT